MMRLFLRLFASFMCLTSILAAVDDAPALWRPDMPADAGVLAQEIRALGVTGRVLYVAAHPDDENTRVLTWLKNEALVETAYLSLTRGDGGQNLIGPQLREELGLIRTQELLAARRLDGARQFFTRAVDFGYSKTSTEALGVWGHDAVLADVVWVIRRFQPDVIITRFEPAGEYTHGHHTASAKLAVEAFAAAADPERFPEQLAWVEPWQARRVVWNTGRWFYERRGLDFEAEGLARIDVGDYLPLRGASVGEIAARSRSMHKSQGFGAGASYGPAEEFFKLLVGAPLAGDLFEGVPLDWSAIEGGAPIGRITTALREAFDPAHPEQSVPGLLELRRALGTLPESARQRDKLRQVDRLLGRCLGLHLELTAPAPTVNPGQAVELDLEIIQRLGGPSVELVGWRPPFAQEWMGPARELPRRVMVNASLSVAVPTEAPLSNPYWLETPGSVGLFAVADPRQIGDAENPPAVVAEVRLRVAGEEWTLRVPAVYRRVDPVEGETREAVRIVPAVFAGFADSVMLFPDRSARPVDVVVGSTSGALEGTVRLEAPEGWVVNPVEQPFALGEGEATAQVSFSVSPGGTVDEGRLRAIVTSGAVVSDRDLRWIDFPHLPKQTLMPPAATRAVHVDLRYPELRIGYLPGAGDSVAENLRSIGLAVTELSPADLTAESLADYDTVVLGVRALNTVEGIDHLMPALFEFARQGGTVVVQYNTSHALKTDRLAPFSLELSRDRVTDETAPVTLLAVDHPVLRWPNRIGAADFDGWVQERGLYFPSAWDPAFVPILSWHDAGEDPLAGSLLIAPVGDGHYVYTGISFFRQLPAGVPGAYRLFVNLLALGHD